MLIALDHGGGLGDAFASNVPARSSAGAKAFILPSVIVRAEAQRLLRRPTDSHQSHTC